MGEHIFHISHLSLLSCSPAFYTSMTATIAHPHLYSRRTEKSKETGQLQKYLTCKLFLANCFYAYANTKVVEVVHGNPRPLSIPGLDRCRPVGGSLEDERKVCFGGGWKTTMSKDDYFAKQIDKKKGNYISALQSNIGFCLQSGGN